MRKVNLIYLNLIQAHRRSNYAETFSDVIIELLLESWHKIVRLQ